jgi:amino acid permease
MWKSSSFNPSRRMSCKERFKTTMPRGRCVSELTSNKTDADLAIPKRFDVAPTTKQRLSPFTVFCLIMNRTIASGIFQQPVNVLFGAGSSGVAVVLWCFAGVIILCVVACWLELALTIPIHSIINDGSWIRVSTPRSGGDKNYVQRPPH